MRWDVVVAGGGPAGASAAIRLARAGLDVCVVDRAAFPRTKPCGEFLSPGATPILEELGVRDAIEAAGALRLARVRILAHGAEVELEFPADVGAPPWGFSLSRMRLDAILLEAARTAGAEVLEETVVETVRLEPDRAEVVARGPEGARIRLGARIVIGAGGRNCPVARALGVQRRDARGRFDLLAHWSGCRSEPVHGEDGTDRESLCELSVRGDRYVAIAPVEAGRWNVNCVVPREALRAEPDRSSLYRRLAAASVPAAAGVPDEAVTASDVTPLQVVRATADRTLLIGDAALFLDPFTGQGIYLALRSAALGADAVLLALARGRTAREALAAYDRRRAEEFAARRRVSRALQAVLYRPWAARALIAALAADRRLANRLAAATGDLTPSERVWSLGTAALLAAACLRVG